MKSKEKLLNILNNYKLADKGNGDFLTNDYQDKILKPIYDDLDKLEEYETIFNTPLEEIRKRLKVLEILKRAVIQDELFKLSEEEWVGGHIYFLEDYDSYKYCDLTPNEYESIKEWLEGETDG